MLNDSSPILTACVFFFRRNRIVSKRTPWMTATDAFDREPAAFEKSMGFQGFNCVLRTCRYKSAGATASKQDLQRRKENPIKTDQKDEDPFHGRVIGWGEADEADISVRISLPQILPWSLSTVHPASLICARSASASAQFLDCFAFHRACASSRIAAGASSCISSLSGSF